jgi:CBS domain-containing protein
MPFASRRGSLGAIDVRRLAMKVEDVMTREVITVRPETPLREVAAQLAERKISGVPVVAADGEVLGVVSEGDILFKERGPSPHRGKLARLLDPSGLEGQLKLEARLAKEAMSAPAVTIEPGRSIAQAAQTMLERTVNRLPVVKDEKLVGIVTRADLVRAFVRPDADIAHEIREDVILRTLWITPESVSVTVENGDVRLVGDLETKQDAELASAFVGRVPGVVSVDSRLTWRDDGGKRR